MKEAFSDSDIPNSALSPSSSAKLPKPDGPSVEAPSLRTNVSSSVSLRIESLYFIILPVFSDQASVEPIPKVLLVTADVCVSTDAASSKATIPASRLDTLLRKVSVAKSVQDHQEWKKQLL